MHATPLARTKHSALPHFTLSVGSLPQLRNLSRGPTSWRCEISSPARSFFP